MDCTEGHLLGGRVAYVQPARGFRTGIEPVLLAASIPARPGDRVLEGGCGAGAALLCLVTRVPGLHMVGVERDPALAALARANLAGSDVEIRQADVTRLPASSGFDHVFANPPWHRGAGTVSPEPLRQAAKQSHPGLIEEWVGALAGQLRRRGTITLILAAGLFAEATAALVQAGCAEATLLPLWPRAGESAKLVLLRGVRGGGGPSKMLSGWVLHRSDGRYTESTEAVLRAAAPLPVAD